MKTHWFDNADSYICYPMPEVRIIKGPFGEKIERVWNFCMENKHMDICKRLNTIYIKKNQDYGDSFHQSYIEYGPAMSAIRLEDKLNRFKNIVKTGKKLVKDESTIDTLLDLANYAIMTVMELDG